MDIHLEEGPAFTVKYVKTGHTYNRRFNDQHIKDLNLKAKIFVNGWNSVRPELLAIVNDWNRLANGTWIYWLE